MAQTQRGSERWARIGIAVQFLALIRCLGEYFRLKHVQGAGFVPADAEVFVLAALIMAVLTAIGVGALLLLRPRWSIACAVLSVAALLWIRVMLMP